MDKTMTRRTAALVSGIGLLAMALLAAPANFVVVEGRFVAGDAALTAANITAAEGSFRLGALALVVVAVLDVVVAWSLYVLFRESSPGLSLLTAWMRLAYAAVFAVAIFGLFGAARHAAADADAAFRLFEAFRDGWMVSLVFFGIHLVLLGILAWRADFIHTVFGLLLILAGLGYIADSLRALVFPGTEGNWAMFTFIGEVVFLIWLLVRARRLNEPATAGVRS